MKRTSEWMGKTPHSDGAVFSYLKILLIISIELDWFFKLSNLKRC